MNTTHIPIECFEEELRNFSDREILKRYELWEIKNNLKRQGNECPFCRQKYDSVNPRLIIPIRKNSHGLEVYTIKNIYETCRFCYRKNSPEKTPTYTNISKVRQPYLPILKKHSQHDAKSIIMPLELNYLSDKDRSSERFIKAVHYTNILSTECHNLISAYCKKSDWLIRDKHYHQYQRNLLEQDLDSILFFSKVNINDVLKIDDDSYYRPLFYPLSGYSHTTLAFVKTRLDFHNNDFLREYSIRYQ